MAFYVVDNATRKPENTPPGGTSPDEQRRIADLLWSIEHHRVGLRLLRTQLGESSAALVRDILAAASSSSDEVQLRNLIRPDRPLCYGVVQPGDDDPKGVPLVRVCDMESDAIEVCNLRKVGKGVDRQYSRSRLLPGDLLVSVVGTIGRVTLVTEALRDANIARAVARISPDTSKVVPEFLLSVLSSGATQSRLETAALESARKTLNLSTLGDMRFRIPPLDSQRLLQERMDEVDEALESVGSELAATQQLGQALLADALGGAE